LRVVDVGFDLVDGRDDGGLGEENFEILYGEVGYSVCRQSHPKVRSSSAFDPAIRRPRKRSYPIERTFPLSNNFSKDLQVSTKVGESDLGIHLPSF